MSNILKEKIEVLNEAELAELSLKETLSVEEAICDVSDLAFLVETADLPVDPSSVKELGGVGDFDKYQFFNQNQIAGISEDDLLDLLDPDSRTSQTGEENKGDLNEAMVGGAGNLNHDYVVRNAADLNNGDLSIQMTEIPASFDEILTGGNTLRRSTDSKHAQATGVPIDMNDLLNGGKIVASNVADEVNGKDPEPTQKGIEHAVAHPVGSHQNNTLKEGAGYIGLLLGEEAGENSLLQDDGDGGEDGADDEDDGEDDDDSEAGNSLPDDFDEDSFLASLDSEV